MGYSLLKSHCLTLDGLRKADSAQAYDLIKTHQEFQFDAELPKCSARREDGNLSALSYPASKRIDFNAYFAAEPR